MNDNHGFESADPGTAGQVASSRETERYEPVLWNEKKRRWSGDDDEQAAEQLRQAVADEERASQSSTAVSKSSPTKPEAPVESTTKAADEKTTDEQQPIWVSFEPGDPQNPYNWSLRKKRTTIWLVCWLTALVAFAGSSYQMGEQDMRRTLGSSHELTALGLSTFPLGFGLAPLVLAPFSEAYGRYAVYVISSAVYTAFTAGTAGANSIATVIVTRFFAGLAASSGSTLVGGSIADVYESHNRGGAMAIFSFSAFAGTGLGPVVMGYVGQKLGFRWIQGIQAILGGVTTLLILLFTEETRGSVILSRRAKKMRKETGDARYQCKADAERASLVILIKVSLTRPLYLLATEAIVFFFSLWAGIAWGILYLTLPVVGLVFGNVYGFNTGEVGLVFIAISLSAVVGTGLNRYQEHLYRKHVAKRGPEARLYTSCVGAVLLPLGIFMLGATQGRTHWMGPAVSLFILSLGIYTIYLAVFNYLADCYTIYASSALSGQSLCRNLAGFAFPLFTNQMYENLNYTNGCMLAGTIAAVVGITPFVLLAYGPTIRAKSLFAKEMERIRNSAQ